MKDILYLSIHRSFKTGKDGGGDQNSSFLQGIDRQVGKGPREETGGNSQVWSSSL